jgi:hypothetical protein
MLPKRHDLSQGLLTGTDAEPAHGYYATAANQGESGYAA